MYLFHYEMKIFESYQQPITEKPFLTYYPKRQEPKGTVLVFPGGGYEHVSVIKEGSDIAAAFNREGYQVFVLDYRVYPYTGADFLDDAVSAVRTVRSFIREKGFVNQKLALMGFSAGGHLALMETQHWREVLNGDDDINCRPDALILCYPVVTFKDPYAHKGSRKNFLGFALNESNVDNSDDAAKFAQQNCTHTAPHSSEQVQANEAQIRKYSAEEHIAPDFPPVFLWHCEGDSSVPVENSLMLKDVLDRAGIENEAVFYKNGAHGLGLARDDEIISSWFGKCVDWLKKQQCPL